MRAFLVIVILAFGMSLAQASPATSALRDTSEWIVKRFGPGAAGKTVDEVAVATARVVARHGDEALPLLRTMGHAGFKALEEAGESAPSVLKLFARRGEDAVWIISQPRKLAIFLKHGDSAADALLKHPGIADDLLARFGNRAVAPLNALERSGAQRLAMAAQEGVFEKTAQSGALLDVIGKHGQRALDFIWNNKGKLAVAAVLGTFVADPEPYLTGARQLVGDSILRPLLGAINWNPIAYGGCAVLGAVLTMRWWKRSRRERVGAR